MPCKLSYSPDGRLVMISCSRAPKCVYCGKNSESLCDVCDVNICDKCKTTVGDDTDVCKKHNNTKDIEIAKKRRESFK